MSNCPWCGASSRVGVDNPQLAADLTADVFQHVTLGGSLTGPEAFQVVGWKGC